MAKKETQLVECPKCLGSKTISAFYHVANGVCFCCKGAGVVSVAVANKVNPPMSQEARAKAEFVMNATQEQIDKMTFKQLSASREFVHWHYPEYPTLREVWFAKFNERWAALQDIAWEAAHAKRMAAWNN